MTAQFSAPPSTPNTPKSQLIPKQLEFASPPEKAGQKKVLDSPASSVNLDISSLTSTSVTPDFAKLALGRGRGRPRKALELPKTGDYPVDGTEVEKDKYIKKKNTEVWHFHKLSSESSAEYRAGEYKRVKAYQKKKKRKVKYPVKVTVTGKNSSVEKGAYIRKICNCFEYKLKQSQHIIVIYNFYHVTN